MRLRPSKRSDSTSARKWSPPPVRSSTFTREPGSADSIRDFSSSALGIEVHDTDATADTMGSMVQLTDIAAEKVRDFIAGQNAEGDVGLRVGVRGGGCSGFQYALALDEKRDDDLIFETSGIRVLVDPASMQYVDGSTVDFTESFMGSGFEVSNPNVVASCGCGSSFRVADEEPSCGATV